MASRSYSVRLDPKFFEDLMPGESVSGRLNTIVDRYTALMVADENRQAWSDNQWSALVRAYGTIESAGTRDAKGIERVATALEVAGAGAEFARQVRWLSLVEFFALIEQIEVETYSPKRKES